VGHPAELTHDEPAELTVGAIRELMERLEKIEKRLTVAAGERGQLRVAVEKLKNRDQMAAGARVRELASLLDRIERIERSVRDAEKRPLVASDEPAFISALRANGVTRYKRGDLKIELGPAAVQERLWAEVPRCVPVAPFTPDHDEIRAKLEADVPDAILDREMVNALQRSRWWQSAEGEAEPTPPPPPPDEPETVAPFTPDHEEIRAKLEERRRAIGGGQE
jgi:hypothetical protein